MSKTYKELWKEYSLLARQLGKEVEAIRILMMELSQKTSNQWYLSQDQEVENVDLIVDAMKQYLYQNKPVQYIIGYTYFYGLKFFVNSNVLIPRYDTEILVDTIMKRVKNQKDIKILDLCTGSGCIAISLKKNLPNVSVQAIDISTAALKIAEQNRIENQVDVTFYESDLFQNVKDEQFDVIVSNPPYIDPIEEVAVDVFHHEPHLALYSSNHGMAHYEQILKDAKRYLKDKYLIALEIAYNKKSSIEELIKIYFIDAKYEIISDLGGRDRVALIYKE